MASKRFSKLSLIHIVTTVCFLRHVDMTAQVSLSLPPDRIPGGMLWIFQTRYPLNGLGLSHTTTMVETHRQAYVEDFRTISELAQDGYCTGVFGGSEQQLVDAAEGEPTVLQVEIPGSENGYGGDAGTFGRV